MNKKLRLVFCAILLLYRPKTVNTQDTDVNIDQDGEGDACQETTGFSNFGKFLKETVFGQGGLTNPADKNTDYDPFSNLSEGASAANDIFTKLSSIFQAATISQEDEPQSNDEFLSDLIASVAWMIGYMPSVSKTVSLP